MSAQLLRRPAGELKALAESGGAALGPEATAAEVIGWVAEHFVVGQAAVASSMANAVLPHLVARQLPGVDVLFLDTGYHFAETLGTRADVARRLNVNVVDLQPEQSVAEQDAAHGKDLFATNPSLCCQLRKVEPLARALADYEVWFTGIRRDEGPTRTNAPLISWAERHGLVKVNPLAAWSFDELLEYAGVHDVPVNLLLANGYPSIGCWPCTRPVADGEDPRAGRWAGLSKTECGIHT